ncbi:UvrD-helicase domain-containing protein [Neobacillus thermocopriae]|uniref:UvrD-helicase domain-containing protein n=1 Tax=Neobacillus thermocopriae TaxID=1215031 RepID=UPI00376F4F9F
MNKQLMEQEIIQVLIGKEANPFNRFLFQKIREKTEEQLRYILSPINENIFLEACAGSGKTEVIGIKAAYEINKWKDKKGGIAILTFTNEATDTIKKRVDLYLNKPSIYPHYICTLTGFIHGYISQKFGSNLIKKNKHVTEKSFAIIDKDTTVYDKAWLKKYKINIPRENKKSEIYVNQIYKDLNTEDYVINMKVDSVQFKTLYYSKYYQDFLQRLRETKKQDWLFQYDYCEKELKSKKKNFIEDGFANFEDMYNIAFYVLKNNSKVLKKLVERFPVIIIDECQDLSWIELEILKILNNAGAVLHFVGDLNQAIYEFKEADPKSTEAFVNNFNKLRLTNNFRSNDQIVKVANKVASINKKIIGCAKSDLNQDYVFYLEYSDINLLKKHFTVFLESRNIPSKESVILVRQQKLKDEFEGNNKTSHPLIEALQLWNTGIASKQILALELAGQGLQKFFGVVKSRKNYYCPTTIDSIYRWRIFLKDFLNSFGKFPELLDFNDKKYSDWYKLFRENATDILDIAYKKLKPYDAEVRDLNQIQFRTPNGSANQKIKLVSKVKEEYPKVNTIHSVKGKEFEAVMVVSSQIYSSQGTGHWKKWIDDSGEGKRIGYVANTRAKQYLLWAVPKLNAEEKILIESYGFKPFS